MTEKCEHDRGTHCLLSSVLADVMVPIDEKACAACALSDHPRSLNHVTCARAVWQLRAMKKPVDPSLFACIDDALREGPGTELKAILALWAGPDEKCGCNAKIATMNGWGINGCRQNFSTIVDWLCDAAMRQPLWLTVQSGDRVRQRLNVSWFIIRVFPTRWYFRHLVRKAIRNADRTRIRNLAENQARSAR